MMRVISWFSCGVASAVATKLFLEQYLDTLVVRCIVDNEHKDNDRFAADCEKWFGKQIINLRSEKYLDCWDVWEKTKYLNGPSGARCTTEMKKKVRQKFQQSDDIQVFGFTHEEQKRAKRFEENNLEVVAKFPLIEKEITKSKCFEIIKQQKIEIPITYRMGYHNANCIGCVKGGKGYWNKIRIDFPDVFERMNYLEQKLQRSCIKGKYLKDLNINEGRHEDIELPECGLFCRSEQMEKEQE